MDITNILNLIFAGVSAVCALISIFINSEIKKYRNTISGDNNTVKELNNEKVVNVQEYVANKIVNDEEFIEKIATKVAKTEIAKDNKTKPNIIVRGLDGKPVENQGRQTIEFMP